MSQRGTEESNLELRFWRPPCSHYTSPPGPARKGIVGGASGRPQPGRFADLGRGAAGVVDRDHEAVPVAARGLDDHRRLAAVDGREGAHAALAEPPEGQAAGDAGAADAPAE